MAALNVGLNSTFDYQRQVINQLAFDVDQITSGIFTTSVGIGTTNATSKLTVEGNVSVSGILTSFGGFISDINSLPVRISVVGSNLLLNVVGIGSTTLPLV
jgi:hypothetical protein